MSIEFSLKAKNLQFFQCLFIGFGFWSPNYSYSTFFKVCGPEMHRILKMGSHQYKIKSWDYILLFEDYTSLDAA